jgi:peptidoglycan/LPS O-acetylase OafA/YrhL
MPLNSDATPLLALLVYGTAILTSLTLVRFVPIVKATVDDASGTRNTAIDGLRGFLAFGVFIHHCVITWYYKQDGIWQVPPSNLYTELGQASVALFFMITAFLFWSRLLKDGPRIDWRHLYLGRIFRLYPVYILMFSLVLLAAFARSGWSLHEPTSLLASQSMDWLLFTIPGSPDLNQVANTAIMVAYVTWTLLYEWLFYLALPILGLLFARSGKSIALVLAGIVLLLMFRTYHWRIFVDLHVLLTFSGGIVAARWVRNERLRGLARSRVASVGASACLLICLFLYDTAYTTIPTILLGIFFVVVASGNTLFGVLQCRAIRWLGEISYSTYLLHGFLVWLVLQRLLAGRQGIIYLVASLATVIALVLLNSVSFLCIERPGIALGRAIDRRWAHRFGRPLPTHAPAAAPIQAP